MDSQFKSKSANISLKTITLAAALALIQQPFAHAKNSNHGDEHAGHHAAPAATAEHSAKKSSHGDDEHAATTHHNKSGDHGDKHKTTTHAATTAHGHDETGVAPETAMGWLKNGNTRFLKGSFRKDGASRKDVARLSSGQTPHTIIVSCSDSRVPPEVVFDQKLGEIFTVRTAGEALDPSSIASVEYAVEHLGARNVVVMGHTQCGAVKAALGTLGGGDAGSDNLNKLVADLHPRLQSFKGKKPSPHYADEGWANAFGVSNDLLKRSKILSAATKDGKIKITTAMYSLENGRVDFKTADRGVATEESHTH
jgi:carbonic anhydrase